MDVAGPEPPAAEAAQAAGARADLILHPVRLRILTAVAGRELTAGALAALLPEVAQATLYRQLGTLTRGGVLRVVRSQPVRGARERVYALAEGGASVDQTEAATLDRATLERAFTVFVGDLLAGFRRYLHRPESDPARDGVGFRQVPLSLSTAELLALTEQLNRVLLPALAHGPAPGRQRLLFSSIVFPDPAGPAA